jgi:hypothetical protein
MNLTEQQKAEMARVRAEGRRAVVDFTPEQRTEWLQHVAEAEANKGELIEKIRRQDQAACEPGFSGDLRRAILASGKAASSIADEIGMNPDILEDFCTGDGILPSDVIGKLVEHLGLRLMKELS